MPSDDMPVEPFGEAGDTLRKETDMKNSFGQSITLTLFGESHGAAIGSVLDGLAPGLKIDEAFIKEQLSLRIAGGAISTARKEPDEIEIVSGVFNGCTTGTPLCILIRNKNTKSTDYEKTKDLMRPGHADYTAFCKYHGFQDYRGGGHFSGRITAALVAAGAILLFALREKNIYIGTHINRCAGIDDAAFADITQDVKTLCDKEFPVLDDAAGEKMREAILAAKADCDSVGGILQTAITGLPAGLGEPWFDTFEGILSHALFSIPALKGVEFGAGFAFADMRGSSANDSFYYDNDKIYTHTNHNGGINGGITNGMPVIFNSVIKPTPSIAKEQATIDIKEGVNASLSIKGRHDPAIIHRARAVVHAVTALVVSDMLALRYGTDYLV